MDSIKVFSRQRLIVRTIQTTALGSQHTNVVYTYFLLQIKIEVMQTMLLKQTNF